jgi:hypothetical protein
MHCFSRINFNILIGPLYALISQVVYSVISGMESTQEFARYDYQMLSYVFGECFYFDLQIC